MDVTLRIYNATCLLARDAVSQDGKNRETEMRKARRIVDVILSNFYSHEPLGLQPTKSGILILIRKQSIDIDKQELLFAWRE